MLLFVERIRAVNRFTVSVTLCCVGNSDVPGRMSRESVDDVMRLPDLIASQRSRRVFDVVELSGVSGAGFPALLEWLLPGAGPLYPV